jgi:Uma2 family endonuclease
MTPTVTAPPEPETLADLLHRLGDVPPERVRWRSLGTATEADVLRLAEGEPKRLCELVDRVLVEKPMGYREAALAALFIQALLNFVRPRRLGVVAGADGLMRLAQGLVRIPDVSFVSRDRVPIARAFGRSVADFAPDLAVEVLSPSNTRREMERKRREYFAAGTQLVWEVDPDARAVDVFTAPGAPAARLTEADTLDGGTVLPGFTLPLRDLFGEMDVPAAP